MHERLLGLIVVALMAGCGLFEGRDIFEHRRVDTALLGVYEIESWTVNESGCDREGRSILEETGNPLLFVQKYTFLWTDEWIMVGACQELDGCKRLLEQGPLVSMMHKDFEFSEGSDADGWTGLAATPTAGAGFMSRELPCEGTLGKYSLSVTKWPQIKIVSKEAERISFIEDENGECDIKATEANTTDLTDHQCTRYQVIRASMLEQFSPPI